MQIPYNSLFTTSQVLHNYFIATLQLLYDLCMTFFLTYLWIVQKTCSILVQTVLMNCSLLIHNLFMTCSWLVHYLFMTYMITCSLLFHYLLTNCSWVVHDMFMTWLAFKTCCLWLVHDLFITFSWFVHYLAMSCSLLDLDLFMTTLKLLHFLTTFQILLVHDFFTSYSQFVTDLFLTCSLLAHFLFMIDFFLQFLHFSANLQIHLNNFTYTTFLDFELLPWAWHSSAPACPSILIITLVSW